MTGTDTFRLRRCHRVALLRKRAVSTFGCQVSPRRRCFSASYYYHLSTFVVVIVGFFVCLFLLFVVLCFSPTLLLIVCISPFFCAASMWWATESDRAFTRRALLCACLDCRASWYGSSLSRRFLSRSFPIRIFQFRRQNPCLCQPVLSQYFDTVTREHKHSVLHEIRLVLVSVYFYINLSLPSATLLFGLHSEMIVSVRRF